MSRVSAAVKSVRKAIDQLANLPGVKAENTVGGVLLQSSVFTLDITIGEDRLGLYFTVTDADGRYMIDHYYDTQYTNITEHNRSKILVDYANSLCANIEAIANNRVLVGRYRGRIAMILPFETDYMRVWGGIIVLRSKLFRSLDEAMEGGIYEPLIWR